VAKKYPERTAREILDGFNEEYWIPAEDLEELKDNIVGTIDVLAEFDAAPTTSSEDRDHRKICSFCVERVDHIDEKQAARLRRCLSDRPRPCPGARRGPAPTTSAC
jgi:hypothetical protein